MTKIKILLFAAAAIIVILLTLMVDEVHFEGDHTSAIVLAPYPTPRFAYSGGEDGSWEQNNPGVARPWYLTGKYIVLMESIWD